MAQWTARGSINNTYMLELNVNERSGSASTSTNTSIVDWSVILRSTGGYSFGTIGSTVVVNVDGQVYNQYSQKDLNAGGSITIASGSKTITHTADGSKTISCSASYTQSSGASYTPGNMSCGGDLTLTKIARYGTSNQSLNSRSINSIKMNWSSNATVDYVWYRTSSSGSWTAVGSVNATSGNYTISNLNPNTTYNIQTRIRRKDSQLTTDSSSLSVTTYDYAKISSAPNVTIGNNATVSYSNPSGATIAMAIYRIDGSTVIAGYRNVSGSSYTFSFTSTEINNMYNSTPNNTSVTLRYYLRTTANGKDYYNTADRTFSVNTANNKPTFTDFTYRDTRDEIIDITGNNQIIVNRLSNLEVVIPSGNKAVAKNGATMRRYRITFRGTITEATYESSRDVIVNLGRFSSTSAPEIIVTAIDSRGIETSVSKTPTFIRYTEPVISANVHRESGVGDKVFYELSGSYWNGNFGKVDNSITVSYQYKKQSDNTWSPTTPIDLTKRIKQESGRFSTITTDNLNFLPTTDNGTVFLKFEFGVNYNIRFFVNDKTVAVGTNNEDVLLNSGIMATSKRYNTDGTYSVGINKLADNGFAFDVLGNTQLNGHDMDDFLLRNDGIRLNESYETGNEQIFSHIFAYEWKKPQYGIAFVTIGNVKPTSTVKFVIQGVIDASNPNFNTTHLNEFTIEFYATSSSISVARCTMTDTSYINQIYVCTSDNGLMLGFANNVQNNESYAEWQTGFIFIDSVKVAYNKIDYEQIKGENWQVLFANDFSLTNSHVLCAKDCEIVSNEDGTAYKFANGILICTFQRINTLNCTNAWGNLYYARDTKRYYFPVPFIENPTVTKYVQPLGSSGCFLLEYQAYNIVKDSFDGYCIARPTSVTGVNHKFMAIAIGRWK